MYDYNYGLTLVSRNQNPIPVGMGEHEHRHRKPFGCGRGVGVCDGYGCDFVDERTPERFEKNLRSIRPAVNGPRSSASLRQ